jgi:CSLREA domain-containing protein
LILERLSCFDVSIMRFAFSTVLLSIMFFLGINSPAIMAAPPVNDDWINRIQISPSQLSAGFNDAQNLADATVESTDPGLPCVIGNPQDRGNTAWYGLTTTVNELYLKASTGEGFGSVMVLVTGTPGNFKAVVGGCNDEGEANSGSAIDGLKLAANTSYSIMIARPTQSAEDAPLNFAASLALLKRVTKVADTADGDCSINDCSLREAIQSPGGGAIELPAGSYSLSIFGGNEDSSNTGDLDINKGLFIYSANAATTIIRTSLGDRLIDVDPQNSVLGYTVGLFNLTVSGGGGPNFVGTGGCINTSIQAGNFVGAGPPNEYLVLSNVVVTNCRSALAGGAVSLLSTPFHIVDSTIKNSTAASGGGGIQYGFSSLDSVGQGVIERSTISGNTSDAPSFGGGGGIQNRGSLLLISSTVSGNRAARSGGGILVTTQNNRTILVDSTVANNVADYDGNGNGQGGGIRFDVATTVATYYQILNSVFADNRVGNGTLAQDCHANTVAAPLVLSVNNSWFQAPDPTCAIIAPGNVGNTINQAAMLGSLANNGGVSETHPPLPGSPLIDNLNSANCGPIDQRGVVRPQDGDGNGSSACDIGAVELLFAPPGLIFKDSFEG